MMSRPLVALALSSLSIGACSQQAPPPASGLSAQRASSAGPSGDMSVAPTRLSDAQIAKVLETIDEGEIADAQLALEKASIPDVRRFAAQLLEAHTRSSARTKAWQTTTNTTPEQSSVSEQLSAEDARTLSTLRGSDVITFDAAYLAAEALQHEELLSLLYSRLTPSASDERLKGFLRETLAMAESHGSEAKALQSALMSRP